MKEGRIISIYCKPHDTKYWYDIDNRLRDIGYFIEIQRRGRGIMRISSEESIIYVLRRNKDTDEIKYKCSIKDTLIEAEESDPYEHNHDDSYSFPYFFRADFIEAYEDGCFPLKKLRELNLVNNHYQLNGDKISPALYDYIESNKKVDNKFRL